jgi:hypothetical protein
MDSHASPPLNFTFGASWRMGLLIVLIWMIGDALDGGSQSIIPPLLAAVWLYVIVALDRWVFQRTGEGSPSSRS